MILPFLETTTGRSIPLANVLQIQVKPDSCLISFVHGLELEFTENDADDLAENLESVLDACDRAQLPIVGFDERVLILPNFVLIDVDDGDETDAAAAAGDNAAAAAAAAPPAAAAAGRVVTLTDPSGKEEKFTGHVAALIVARMEFLSAQMRALLGFAAGDAPAAEHFVS